MSLLPGSGDRAVLEFRSDHDSAEDLRVTLVLTMLGGKITAMRDHRRRATALRAAGVPAHA